MKYLLHQINNSPTYIAFIFDAGGIYQPVKKLGISHLVEHLLISECKKTKYKIDAQTDYKSISFFTQTISQKTDDIEEVISKICDIIDCFSPSSNTMSHEIATIKSEVANFSYDYPNTNKVVLHDYLFTALAPIKNQEIISGDTQNPANNVNLEDIRRFITDRFKYPDQIIVTGDIDKKKLNNWLNNRFIDDTKKPRPEIIRSCLPQETTIISDKSKSTSIKNTYYGIGWAIRCKTKKEIAALILAFNAIASTNHDLYKKLRGKSSPIYNFVCDQSYANGQLNLSLHTSYSETDNDQMTNTILDFVSDEKILEITISSQAEIEKQTSPHLSDGSKQTYSSEFFFSRFDLSIAEYLGYLNELSVREIVDIFVRYIRINNATILIS